MDVSEEGAEHDEGGAGKDSSDEGFGEDTRVFWARRAGHDSGVDGLDAEGLSGGAVHQNV